MSLEIFSKNVRYLRRKYNLTQQDLADKLGSKRPTVGAWEEARAYPGIETLLELCDLFNVKERDILTLKLFDPSQNPAIRPGTAQAAKELGAALHKIVETANQALKP